MKTSVLIIAHNEERYIAKCIESVLRQTKRPDEVVLLVHNSTDKTRAIAESFPLTVVPFNGPAGIVSARLEGLTHVSGDIILCLDGDSFACENWVEVMTTTLQHDRNVWVGSWVKFSGTLFGALYNLYSKHPYLAERLDVAYWLWGSSYAFWGRDKDIVKEIFQKSAALSSALHLPRNPEDYWLALFMSRRGNLERTSKTWVTHYTKETSLPEMILRRIESNRNMHAMKSYFKNSTPTSVNLNSPPL